MIPGGTHALGDPGFGSGDAGIEVWLTLVDPGDRVTQRNWMILRVSQLTLDHKGTVCSNVRSHNPSLFALGAIRVRSGTGWGNVQTLDRAIHPNRDVRCGMGQDPRRVGTQVGQGQEGQEDKDVGKGHDVQRG